MTLIDTSVWIEFLRGTARAARLAELLDANEALLHPWVLGELALGGLGKQREAVLADLRRLPRAQVVNDDEVVELIHSRELVGRGIGWVDAQLLAASLIADSALWTFDGTLAKIADKLGIETG